MITEKELDRIGFLKYGEEDDDIYYKIVFTGGIKFGISSLAGYLNNGEFYLYDNKKYYYQIDDLEGLFNIVGGENIYRRVSWKQ